jgi:hypothetical protein
MLRTAIGAFDALLGGSAARGNLGDTVGRRLWSGRASTRVAAAPWQQRALMSQLRASRTAATQSRIAPRARPTFFRPKRPFHSTRPRRSDAGGAKNEGPVREESLSLRDRLKKLSREYGWAAVGIYLTLSVLDFPFCFLLVRTVGTEKIGKSRATVDASAQS